MSKFKLAAALALCAFLTPAFAQSLAEREKFAYQEKELAKEAEHTAEICKTDIKVKFDWSTFNKEDIKEYSPSGFCGEALSGIRHVCEHSEDGLKSVQSKIKGLTCKQSSALALSLENGELVFGFGFKDSNLSDKVRTFLMDNL
jgi:hypothetical protein